MTTRHLALFLMIGALASCRAQPRRSAAWEVGYWYWAHSSRERGPVSSAVLPDVVYVHVGRFSAGGLRESRWPRRVPPARSYVAMWRSDEAEPPDARLGPSLAAAFAQVEAQAARAGQRVVGLQLDVDCPTRRLGAYADFFRDLRPRVRGRRLSVTALLDWFGRGTDVDDLLASVDEYVPQFYDAGAQGLGTAIAEPIDPRRWAAVFNGFTTPYRIGVATFGRIQRVRSSAEGVVAREPFRDVTLLDLWSQGLRVARADRNGAAEQVVTWDVARAIPPALQAGDAVEAVLPTREAVRRGAEAAHAFGGLCAGVVFFRWPGADETLLMTPDEVAASLNGERPDAVPRVQAADGVCVSRHCADLTAHIDDRFLPRPLELTVVASSDVDYVVPAHSVVTLRQTGAREIVVRIPAFVGEHELRLGRVFSRRPNRYEMAGGRP